MFLKCNQQVGAVIAVRDDDVLHALRDSKQAKSLHLPVEFWQTLPEKLRHPSAILHQQDRKGSHNLLFIYKTEQGKVAIKLDYELQIKDKVTKKKERVKLNMVRTASRFVDKTALMDFELLWGSLD